MQGHRLSWPLNAAEMTTFWANHGPTYNAEGLNFRGEDEAIAMDLAMLPSVDRELLGIDDAGCFC